MPRMLVIAWALWGCADPVEVPLPGDITAWSTDAAFQTAMSELEPAQQARLESYRQRYLPDGPMKGQPWSEGTKIRHALEEQGYYEEQAALHQAAVDQEAAEKQARLDALLKVLSVRFVGATFLNADWRTGRQTSELFATFRFQNEGDRELLGFQGTIELQREGRTLVEIPVLYGEPLAARTIVEWRHDFEHDSGSASQQALISAPLEAVMVVWHPKRIGFADGTMLALE